MNGINDLDIGYIGNVNIKIPVNGKMMNIHRKNKGLSELFRIISKALAGNDISNDKPSYIDLRFLNDYGEWQSCLSRKQSIAQLSFNMQDGNWVTRAASSIPYSALTITPISELGEGKLFRLYLMSRNDDLAYIDISSDDVYSITPGTQALIEWILKLVNAP